MDHHCAWYGGGCPLVDSALTIGRIGTCIGPRNRKEFVIYVWSTWLLCTAVGVLCGYRLYYVGKSLVDTDHFWTSADIKAHGMRGGEDWGVGVTWNDIFDGIVASIVGIHATGFGSALYALSVNQCILLSLNRTHVEELKDTWRRKRYVTMAYTTDTHHIT